MKEVNTKDTTSQKLPSTSQEVAKEQPNLLREVLSSPSGLAAIATGLAHYTAFNSVKEPTKKDTVSPDNPHKIIRPLSASEHDFIFRSLCIGNTKVNNPNIKLSNQILRKMQKYVTKSTPRKIAFAVRISSIYYDQNTDEKWYYMYLEAFENVPLLADQSFIDLYYPEDGDYLVVSATGKIHTVGPDRLREEYEILTDITEADKISEMLYFE